MGLCCQEAEAYLQGEPRKDLPVRQLGGQLSGPAVGGFRSEEVKEACFWDSQGREPGDGDSS